MVDTFPRTDQETPSAGSRQAKKLIASLRQSLLSESDPRVREQALRLLEQLQARSQETEGRKALSPDPSILLASALGATGLTKEPGELELTENARVVLERRYLLKDESGKTIETSEGMFRRVARAIAEADRLYDSKADVDAVAEEFYKAMARLEFLPNSPTLMNAGTGAGTLSACFVLPLEDSMVDIMKTASDIAMVQKFGGGTGVALSRLRSKGAPISTTHGRACGPIAVLKHLSSVSTMITQGGKRDGANMAIMDVHHPDILEFITCKHQEGVIHNYNISVGADEEFMQAVEQGGVLELRDPGNGHGVRTLDAREVFQRIVEGAWRNGEPGMIFLDQVNRDNPTLHLGRITSTNPCGEQPLLPHESCNLGSINLARILRYEEGQVALDWEKLGRTVRLCVHFLDNVIDANRYSVPEIERMTKLTRKIGLGVMGFADMLVRLGVRYDSEEGLALGREVMAFIREEADAASTELARERGVFPAFKGSRYDAPGMPAMRNACRLTVAPTGTISMIAGCSSGVEPLFALAFRKHNILEGQTLYYVDQAFDAVARYEGFSSDHLMEYLSKGDSLQGREDVPAWVREVFVTAPDIAPEWHVRMQAAFQESTDAAISKTINFPNEATVEDVRTAYLLAWKLGCKGITVYRAGSREQEVLTAGTREQESGVREKGPEKAGLLVPRSRPQSVRGVTQRIRTGHGNMYVTVNFDEEGRPFEVFTNLGKAGGCDSANLEAVARLVSVALRAGVDPEEVVTQLRGITCDPAWDSGVLVRSAPDALAIALARALGREPGAPYGAQMALFQKEELKEGVKEPLGTGERRQGTGIRGQAEALAPASSSLAPGRLRHWGSCPECAGPLVYQEGCFMCRQCGYNKCG